MTLKIGIFFILTILIPTSFLAYLGLSAVRSEKVIIERNMRQKYEAMAGIVDEEIRTMLSQASEKLLGNQQYWESVLLKGAGVFKDEVVLFDRQGRPVGQGAGHELANAAYVKAVQGLPYFIAVFEQHPFLIRTLEAKQQNLTYYISIIIFSAFSILGGSIFTLSALSREWRQAKLKSEFASHLSHDLRRPLTSIRMFSEMLKNNDVPSEDKKKEYYGIISDESEKLTHLANNILDFSRIEEGRRRYNMQEEDITRIVRETVERFKVYTINEARSVSLNIEQPSLGGEQGKAGVKNAFPTVKVDAGAISQALMNLLTNADKYSPPDKAIYVNVTWTAGTGLKHGPARSAAGAGFKPALAMGMKRRKGHVVIEVIDEGEGISKEDQKRIFDKFYRAERKDLAQVEGSGLGLALVKHMALAHGGRVVVKSEVGKGSKFAIILPA